MTISIKPTASGSTIEQDGSTILTVDGSGNISIANDLSVTGNVPANTGPAFRVGSSINQSLSQSTFTKLQLDVESFDTDSMFDATTNYRFLPTIEGYYQLSATVGMNAGGARLIIHLRKNGVNDFVIWDGTANNASGSGLMYMNGTTDYAEIYVRTDRSGGDGTQEVRFTGHLARAA